MKTLLCCAALLAGVLVGFVIGPCFAPDSAERGTVTIRTNTITQTKTVERIVKVPTTASEIEAIVEELNRYRQDAGWLRINGSRVYAGLVAREWYAEIDVSREMWHAAAIIGPGAVGALIQRRVGPVWLGVAAGYSFACVSAGVAW